LAAPSHDIIARINIGGDAVAALDQAGEFVALLLDKEQSGKTVATPTLVAVKE
jgi:hypothetical protein